MKRTLKRKLGPIATSSSRKRLRVSSTTVDDLPWKTSRTQADPAGFGNEGDGDILELEEVEGVEVVYEEGEGGRIVHFRVSEERPHTVTVQDTGSEHGAATPIELGTFDAAALLPSWHAYNLHIGLLNSIHNRGFFEPTAIQKRTLDELLKPEEGAIEQHTSELRQRDIVGIAETGSGKTLAYGLPILHHLLNSISTTSCTASSLSCTVQPPPAGQRRPVQALVLAPTRELALQVSDHLNACLDQITALQSRTENRESGANAGTLTHKSPPPVSVAAIVGGMSAQKQRRILSRGVDILVATPGRLWDLYGEDTCLSSQLRSLRFLVLDEADRMVEAGHFQELDDILRIVARSSEETDAGDITSQDPPAPMDIPSTGTEGASRGRNESLQTFLFSATMSKDLQRDLKRRHGSRLTGKQKGDRPSTLDDLMMKIDFRDPDPVIIDLSPEGGHVESLQESKVECLMNDKDIYLYYFLLRHPGRSLVFFSSIDGIRRVIPLLELLKLNAWPLHSGLQQKQRLKNLDRFKSAPNSILLATDVAARGLDVPAVDHVIHYQVPRSADAYVHRNGRTARAKQKGFGLVLCAPDERRVLKSVLAGLGRVEDDVQELNVEHDMLNKLKGRVQLARKIDSAAHRVKKATHEKNWMRETAEAMEIELGSEFESDASETTHVVSKKRLKDAQVASLKAELKQALSQPLVARGVSTKYITSGSRALVDDLVGGSNHETMLGLKKLEAGSEVVRAKKRRNLKNKGR